MTLLEVSQINKQGEDRPILQNISFTQKKYQKIAVTGETGSGKSTLLKTLAGLVQPDSGEVIFQGERVKGPDEKLVPGHASIAYLSQSFELPHSLRVEQVLSYANVLTAHAAAVLYEVCGIDHLLQRRTDQLSGGEKQRTALAQLLTGSPALLLLDEPFSNLDVAHKTILKSVIREIGEKLKITCMLVSHDPADTLSWADRILVMKDGQIVQQGTPQVIYKKPVSEYVAGLFGKYNLIDPGLAAALRIKPDRKKLLLARPEEIIVSKKGKANGTVVASGFFGSHYETEVKVGGKLLLGRTQHIFRKGEAVRVAVSSSDQ